MRSPCLSRLGVRTEPVHRHSFASRSSGIHAAIINEALFSTLEQKEGYAVAVRLSQTYLTPTHMRSVNKIILVGHLAADPESTEVKPGTTRVTFPVATHREYTADGEKKEVTDYHRVVSWGKLAEICAKYLSKGQGVYVEGTLLNRAYEKEGERKYITEIRADEVNMLTWKRKGGVEKVSLAPVEIE